MAHILVALCNNHKANVGQILELKRLDTYKFVKPFDVKDLI